MSILVSSEHCSCQYLGPVSSEHCLCQYLGPGHMDGSYERLSSAASSSVRGSLRGSRATDIGGSFRNISGLPRDEDQVTIEIPSKFSNSLSVPT